jgi:hypothetical protein
MRGGSIDFSKPAHRRPPRRRRLAVVWDATAGLPSGIRAEDLPRSWARGTCAGRVCGASCGRGGGERGFRREVGAAGALGVLPRATGARSPPYRSPAARDGRAMAAGRGEQRCEQR